MNYLIAFVIAVLCVLCVLIVKGGNRFSDCSDGRDDDYYDIKDDER